MIAPFFCLSLAVKMDPLFNLSLTVNYLQYHRYILIIICTLRESFNFPINTPSIFFNWILTWRLITDDWCCSNYWIFFKLSPFRHIAEECDSCDVGFCLFVCGSRIAQSLIFCVVLCITSFLRFLLALVLSILRFTTSEYHFWYY